MLEAHPAAVALIQFQPLIETDHPGKPNCWAPISELDRGIQALQSDIDRIGTFRATRKNELTQARSEKLRNILWDELTRADKVLTLLRDKIARLRKRRSELQEAKTRDADERRKKLKDETMRDEAKRTPKVPAAPASQPYVYYSGDINIRPTWRLPRQNYGDDT